METDERENVIAAATRVLAYTAYPSELIPGELSA